MFKFISTIKIDFLILSVLVIAFFPILNSGYYSDDALLMFNSRTQGFFEFFSYQMNVHKYWWLNNGRFMYGGILFSALPLYIFGNIVSYKLFVFVVNIISFYFFSVFISKVYGKKIQSYFVVFFAAFLQFRDYHDAYLSFSILLPSILFLLTITLEILRIAILERKNIYCLYAALVYTIALLTYELSFPLLFAIPGFLYAASLNFKKSLSYSSPVFLIAFLVLIIARYPLLNSGIDAANVSYIPNYDFNKIVITATKQLSSTLPLSYFFFKPSIGSWGIVSNPFITMPTIFSAFLSVLLSIIVYLSLLKTQVLNSIKIPIASCISTFVIIFALFVLPAVSISFSPKYQNEIVWGVAYLPYYFQIIGFSLMLAFIVSSFECSSFINGRTKRLFFVFISIVALISSNTNFLVVLSQKENWLNPEMSDLNFLSEIKASHYCKKNILLFSEKPWLNLLNLEKITGFTDVKLVKNLDLIQLPSDTCVYISAADTLDGKSAIITSEYFDTNTPVQKFRYLINSSFSYRRLDYGEPYIFIKNISKINRGF